LELPKGCDTTELFHKCKEEEKVIFIPGAGMFVDMEANANYIRMSYTACKLEEMEEGIKRVGGFLKRNIPE
jgi:DNA-binding transcriptional MocR family regulator